MSILTLNGEHRETLKLTEDEIQHLLKLPEEERVLLVDRLLGSVVDEASTENEDSDLSDEINRRIESYLAGRSVTYSPEEVNEFLRERIRQRRLS